MSEPFLAEIRIFPFNFTPNGWLPCDGRLLPISQNTALFSLLGTTYGGDGKSTFALPDLRGRVPMHFGNGNGLTPRNLGEMDGVTEVTLIQSEMPAHTHPFSVSPDRPETTTPQNNYFGTGVMAYAPPQNTAPMSPNFLAPAGNSMPHDNMQPSLAVGFFIAAQGIYPSRG